MAIAPQILLKPIQQCPGIKPIGLLMPGALIFQLPGHDYEVHRSNSSQFPMIPIAAGSCLVTAIDSDPAWTQLSIWPNNFQGSHFCAGLGVEPSNCRHSVTCRACRSKPNLITSGLAFASPPLAWFSLLFFIEPTM